MNLSFTCFLSCSDSIVTSTSFDPDLVATTLCDNLNSSPCFSNDFINSVAISPSIVGTMRSNFSTTVTLVPSLDHTDPISKPMYPPPITNMVFGTADKDKAPVDVTIFFSSTVMPGLSIEEEPVAMIKFFADSVNSLVDLTLMFCLSTNDAVPFKYVILFFLNKKPIPAVSCLTILSLRCIKVERSKATFPVLIPCSSA